MTKQNIAGQDINHQNDLNSQKKIFSLKLTMHSGLK